MLSTVVRGSTLRRLVAAFRAWLSGRGGGGPVPVTEKKELLPAHELLNHYDQHVRHCPSCSKVPLCKPHLAPCADACRQYSHHQRCKAPKAHNGSALTWSMSQPAVSGTRAF